MWIRLSNGRVEKVLHEAHITRLLNEGGVEVPDPTIPPARVEEEASHVVEAGEQPEEKKQPVQTRERKTRKQR